MPKYVIVIVILTSTAIDLIYFDDNKPVFAEGTELLIIEDNHYRTFSYYKFD